MTLCLMRWRILSRKRYADALSEALDYYLTAGTKQTYKGVKGMINFTRDQLAEFPVGVSLSFYTDRLQDYSIEPHVRLDHRRIVADIQLGGVEFTFVGLIDPDDVIILVELSWHEDGVSFEGFPLDDVNMAKLEQVLIEKDMTPVLENDLIEVPSHQLGFYFFEDRVRAISWTTPDFES